MKNIKLNNCIDCKVKLTDKNRSKHQPGIRCLECFELFSNKVKNTLLEMQEHCEQEIANVTKMPILEVLGVRTGRIKCEKPDNNNS